MTVLLEATMARLEREIEGFERYPKGQVHPLGTANIGIHNGREVNVRTTSSPDSAGKYWGDISDTRLEQTAFIVYACGDADTLYVFPTHELATLVAQAKRGERDRRPGFSIEPGTHRLLPNGGEKISSRIGPYFNALNRIGPLPDNLVRLTMPAGQTEGAHLAVEALLERNDAVRGYHGLTRCEACEALPGTTEVHLLRNVDGIATGATFLLDIEHETSEPEVAVLCPTCHAAAHTRRRPTERKK